MRKWIPGFLIAAAYLLSALAYPRLPWRVSPRWDGLFPWLPVANAETVPRAFAAFAIPTLALAVWLLLRAGASPGGERLGRRIFPNWLLSDRTGAAAIARFGATFDVVVALVVAGLLAFHASVLGTVLGWPGWTLRVFTAFVGLGMMVVGNIMPRTRPNWVAGLRSKTTLSDPDVWRRTHRIFGALLMVTGIGTILVSVGSAPYALVTGLAGTIASAVVATIAGRVASRSQGEPPVHSAAIALLLIGAIALPTQNRVDSAVPSNIVGDWSQSPTRCDPGNARST